jgi:predicted transcriptional regulator
MAEPDPNIFDALEDEAELLAEAEADADIAAGRVVPHERVKDWLKSLGTPNQLPTPYSWRK